MALIEIADLPAATADELRRRARAAGVSAATYLRQELTALAGRRCAIDAVVEFLAAERPDHPGTQIDDDAGALLRSGDLPMAAWKVFHRRASAAGVPLGDYVRQELITLARRGTVTDALLEFREAQMRDPSLNIDMDAVLESVRYARGA
jgi:hypothetical protein